MGYRISALKNLSENFGCYCFLLGDYRNRSMVNDLFRDDFRVVADRIGENAVIIEGTDKGHIEWDLAKALSHRLSERTQLSQYILEFESQIPGLLIMWCHPSKITEKDPIVHIPFQVLEETYSNSIELLTDLVSFVNKKDLKLVQKIEKKHQIIKGLNLSVNIGIICLNIDF